LFRTEEAFLAPVAYAMLLNVHLPSDLKTTIYEIYVKVSNLTAN